MGRLTFSAGDRVYLDTSILVYLVERHPVYFELLGPLGGPPAHENVYCCTSELSLLEALVMPFRNGDNTLIERYERAFFDGDLALARIDVSVLKQAAHLRASDRRLKTPDAIHIATAIDANCSKFLTNDEKLRSVGNLHVVILQDLLAT